MYAYVHVRFQELLALLSPCIHILPSLLCHGFAKQKTCKQHSSTNRLHTLFSPRLVRSRARHLHVCFSELALHFRHLGDQRGASVRRTLPVPHHPRVMDKPLGPHFRRSISLISFSSLFWTSQDPRVHCRFANRNADILALLEHPGARSLAIDASKKNSRPK